jgi:putative regulator of septum formation
MTDPANPDMPSGLPPYTPQGPTQPSPEWPTQTPPPYNAPQKPPSRRGSRIRLAILLIIVAVIGVGFVLLRDRFSNDVTSLQPGECFDLPTETTVTDVQRQPCNEPHDAEVFANVTHTAAADGTYPLSTEFGDLADDECEPQLSTYSGLTTEQLDTRGTFYGYFYPTREGWGKGDRVVTCYVIKVDHTKMTGSIRNAASGASATP